MKKKYLSKALLIIFFSTVFIAGISYVTWRWAFTMNLLTSPATSFISYALCISEILVMIVFTNFSLILLKARNIEKIIPKASLQKDYAKDIFKDDEIVDFKSFCPSVDIFICTLNESVDMLSTTISACKNINYPNHKVFVLDDGRRQEVKELTELLGCNYITRETNKGFKAGNINNALEKTDSQIVVIFDADHIPASTFLRETVYNFVDEKVALVQTPQYFANPDAFQKNLAKYTKLSNEQDVFYRIIEPSLGEFGSVFCGGTNILISRKHLASVGNFPENTITEDSLLGLKFHASGFKVIYYNRPLAVGTAASSFEEYIKQRSRWAKGNVQIITNSANWKYYLKLTPMQLFFYLSGVLYFFTPIARIIFLICPVLFLFFDISPVLILFYQIAAFQVCYFSLKFWFIAASGIKLPNIIFADVYDLVTSIFTLGSILNALLLPGKLSKIKFVVTKKDFKLDTHYKYKLTLTIIFAIVIMAEMQGIYDIMYSDPYSALAIIANLFWNTINAFVLFFAINVVSEKPEKRFYQRVKTDEKLTLENEKHNSIETIIKDISRSGISFIFNDETPESKQKFKANIGGENSEIEILNCENVNGRQICKSFFKNPIEILKITKQYVDRLDKFTKFTYKKPDSWDDYYDSNKKK